MYSTTKQKPVDPFKLLPHISLYKFHQMAEQECATGTYHVVVHLPCHVVAAQW